MSTLTFVAVNNENYQKVFDLSMTLSEEQKRCVASNERSLAQAYVNIDVAWPRAIYLNDIPIGFVMLSYDDEDIPEKDRPALYLWRFMIAKDYQAQGYGKIAMDMLIAKAREEGFKTFYTSCDMAGPMPYQFYIKYGFIDTGTVDEDEEVLKFVL
jgi:diamine N-acetyltransferase